MNFRETVSIVAFATSAFLLGASAASASLVTIDLSGAVTGTSIVAPGGSFAQTFAGQSVSGIGITGSPTNPLTLAPSGSITVAFFNPGVSAAANSLLPQPGNTAPLSLRLDSAADSLTWTMGFGDGGAIDVDLFGLNGALVNSTSFSGLNDYAVFNISGLGTFSGLTFKNNTDAAGLRFMNVSYNSVPAIPEPETYAMMLAGLGLLSFVARRRKQKAG